MILLIDSSDSFTYNIKKVFINEKIKVIERSNLNVEKGNYSVIIIGPGTGKPKLTYSFLLFIKKYYKTTPFIGICLGHQILCRFFKMILLNSKNIKHGQISSCFMLNCVYSNNIPKVSGFCKYNSLVCKKHIESKMSLYSSNKLLEGMFFVHKKYPILCIQFHPESFISNYGFRLLKNIVCYFKKYEL
ncbi:aminodeoxychorismate/anthranilate synthase component II [Candidatus Vidania fulgoroideorum]